MPFKVSVEELKPRSALTKNIVAKLQSLAPVVPAFNYAGESNIEEIKFKLAQRSMHALVMSVVNPKGKAE
jgi:hypothetical protein